MIDYKQRFTDLIAAALPDMKKEEIKAWIEIPQDPALGDLAFPCFRLAKLLRKAPPLIAREIAGRLAKDVAFSRMETAGAYLNAFINPDDLIRHTLADVREQGADFGKSDIGAGRRVIVEFSSPNIAKPFHIGHIRSTVIGNAINKLYAALGFDVFKIDYLGDYGTQFGKMICAYRRWGKKEDVEKEPIKSLLSYYTKFHVEAEKHPELEDEARAIFVRLENGEKEEVELWQWFREESIKEFKRVYDLLGITFDSYNGESFFSDKMPRIERELEEKGLMQESQGAMVVNLEEYDLGNALIKKSDGSSLYITRDIAAAVYRKETYNFYKNIYVVASQQNLHFRQLFKIIDRMGYDWADSCVHVPFGLVRLKEGVMSTRAGRVVFLEDVLKAAVEKTRAIILEKNPQAGDVEHIARQVGIGAVIFNELSNNRIKDYTFDWEQVLNFDGETGPYVQYTYARSSSVLRKAGIPDKSGADLQAKELAADALDTSYLTGDAALTLVKGIYRFPEVIREAAQRYEPSVLTRQIIDIAQAFNKFYHDEHIITENSAERNAKLALVAATRRVLANGLAILGIEAPEKM